MKLKKEEVIYRIYDKNADTYIGSYDKNHWINKKSALTKLEDLIKTRSREIYNLELHTFAITLKTSESAENVLTEYIEEKRLKEKKSLDTRIKIATARNEISRLVPGDLHTIILAYKKGVFAHEILAQLEPHIRILNQLTPTNWK